MTTKQADAVKPIVYHPGIENGFDGCAEACGYTPAQLRRIGERAIRSRHDQATILDHAAGRQPNVWELGLGIARIIYTIELDAIVIRGYSWDIKGKPLDDFDGGGFYTEFSWHAKA